MGNDSSVGDATKMGSATPGEQLSLSLKGLGEVENGARTCARGECDLPLISGNFSAPVLIEGQRGWKGRSAMARVRRRACACSLD